MKKIIAITLALVFAFGMLCAVPASAAGADTVYGDVNGDGSVTPLDAIILMRYLSGWSGYSIDTAASDIDLSGSVNAKDSVILIRHLTSVKGYETLPFTGDNETIDGYIPGNW